MKKRISIVTLCLCIILSISVASAANVTFLSNKSGSVKQEKSNWCWVAAAITSVKYSGFSCNYSQAQVWKYGKDSSAPVWMINSNPLGLYNKTGSLGETRRAAYYASGKKLQFSYTSTYLSFQKLKDYVSKRRYPIMAIGAYDSKGNRTQGHVYVLSNAYTSGGVNYIEVYDPYNNQTYKMTYDHFKNGKFIKLPYGSTSARWDQTVYPI